MSYFHVAQAFLHVRIGPAGEVSSVTVQKSCRLTIASAFWTTRSVFAVRKSYKKQRLFLCFFVLSKRYSADFMLTIHKRSEATDGYYKFSEVGNAVTETYANYLPVVYYALILTDAVEKSLLNIHEQSNF